MYEIKCKWLCNVNEFMGKFVGDDVCIVQMHRQVGGCGHPPFHSLCSASNRVPSRQICRGTRFRGVAYPWRPKGNCVQTGNLRAVEGARPYGADRKVAPAVATYPCSAR